jgi:hypothetical protein
MAVGLNPAIANSLLDALLNQTNYTAPTTIAIQLHTGDPGAAGTANIAQGGAGSQTRKDITAAFPAAAAGSCTNNVDIAWTAGEVDVAEDYTHYSIWTSATPGSGTFLWSGVITANAVLVGDQFKILSGGLAVTFALAA